MDGQAIHTRVGRILWGTQFVLTFVWPSFDAFLALLPDAINARVRNSILDASFARTSFVAAFTGGCAIRTLVKPCQSCKKMNDAPKRASNVKTHSHLDLFAFGTRGITRGRHHRGVA